VAAGKVLGFATSGTGPVYGDRQGITIEASRKNDDFVKNLVTIGRSVAAKYSFATRSTFVTATRRRKASTWR
jgi:hypothetical protein